MKRKCYPCPLWLFPFVALKGGAFRSWGAGVASASTTSSAGASTLAAAAFVSLALSWRLLNIGAECRRQCQRVELKVAWPRETSISAKLERASLTRWDKFSSSSAALITLAADAPAIPWWLGCSRTRGVALCTTPSCTFVLDQAAQFERPL